ncbi:alanine--tRNA ligase [Candidatus Saccharibacteria bacterium]|nr:alanine--tRNA ligase [Candidatus Saccharibacteria bacterium]
MDSNTIREKYLKFFEGKGHKIVEPANLVLEDDPTTLFTGSGMQPLMPYLLGRKHPEGERLANSQPCFRSQDIDDIGDNRHTTFFEMLGNWSLGDYFKEFQIRSFWQFLTEELRLAPSKIYVTCFIGDEENGIPRDDEAAEIWQKVFKEAGVSAGIVEIGSAVDGDERGIKSGERIFFYDDKENWWSRAGGIATTPVGDPCGPDSEVFYDFGEAAHDPAYGKAHPASDSGRFLEIGNQVFMQYRRTESGFELLEQKNVDFGGGLERLTVAAMDTPDVFKGSLLEPIIDKLEVLSHQDYSDHKVEMRIISDHLRAAVFLATQGLTPSNKAQGYVLRRLLRRVIVKAQRLGLVDNFFAEIVPVVSEIYGGFYPTIKTREAEVISVLVREETLFRKALARGLRELEKLANGPEGEVIDGEELFKLQDTYGFPLEVAVEEIKIRGLVLSEKYAQEFEAALGEQRERSQTASKGMFKGGLEDESEMTIKYHTAAHLLDAALRLIVDPKIAQKGANITPERLRYDFSIDRKLTPEEIAAVEQKVNEWIEADLPVTFEEVDVDYAFETLGAHGVFRDKYGDRVTVYTIGSGDDVVSCEICGGPHVKHTGAIADGKMFKIVKEESSSAGVRRVKAQLQ